MHNAKLKIAMVAATLLTSGMLIGTANAANHRESPLSAINKVDDITDWYTYVDPANAANTVIAMNTDGLSVPSNGPNFFPFSAETLYEFKIDNNMDAVEDITMQFRFTRLNSLPSIQNRIEENFTGYAGISGDACFGGVSPAFPGLSLIPRVCTPDLGGNAVNGGGHPAGKNSPLNQFSQISNFGDTGTVIQGPISTLSSQTSPGLGLGQEYTMTIVNSHTGALICSAGPFKVLPTNVGARTMNGYVNMHYNLAVNTGCGGKIFAGTTDDAFPVNLGAAFDTLNLPLICGGGANVPQAEVTQGELGNCAPNQVDGFNVQSIVVSLPTSSLTGGNSSIIGTYGTTSRSRVRVLPLLPGRQATFVGPGGVTVPNGPYSGSVPPANENDTSRVQIARMGQPLFNELIVGTGCKDVSSQGDSKDDATVNNCNVDQLDGRGVRPLGSINGTYPDITQFVLNPVFPRVVDALVTLPSLNGGVVGAIESPDANGPSGLTCTNRCVTTPGSTPRTYAFGNRPGRADMTYFSNYHAFIKEMCELGLSQTCNKPTIGIDPVSDLLRIDTSIPNNAGLLRKRLGPMDNTNLCLLNGPGLLCSLSGPRDRAGYPNGRRLSDDVIDSLIRIEMGALDTPFLLSLGNGRGVPISPVPHLGNLQIGDASQGNDLGYLNNIPLRTDLQGYGKQFPYFAPAQDGANHRAINVLEIGCPLAPGALCPVNGGGPGGV